MPENNLQKAMPAGRQGFVALMSVIIISAILLLVAGTLSFSGFYSRYNILDSELKNRSTALAEACADQGLLLLANVTSHTSTSTVQINQNQCALGTFFSSGSNTVFLTQASSSNYFTTLRITVVPSNTSILSWEELP